ncbi:MAG TPA: helix-turn-helix transcriptional regulator [Allosphingosinicella sp.]|jgi:transcriptional regulator with XRE-family HTH domain|nr:helix-turn-helix transcriptional regulator [Allosphingosinicella sp.]
MDDAAKQEVKRRFGARLRKLRKAQKLSQEKVALKSGIDRSYFGAIERGENSVSLVNIFRIAEALGVEPGELFQDLRSLSN